MRFFLKIAGILLLLYFAATMLIHAGEYFSGRKSLAAIKTEVRKKFRWATWVYVGLAVTTLVWNLLLGQ